MLFVVGPPLRPAFRASSLRGGGPKFLKICSKIHFLSYLPGCWPRLLVQIDPNRSCFTSWCLAGAPVWPEFHRTGLLGCCSVPHTQVYAQAVLKVGAPADVSSVGGTPGVWCLNVIGRECWVWVVPCTGSWPGQPPPTKWGKEP